MDVNTLPYKTRVSRRAKHISLKVDHRGLTIVSPRTLAAADVQKVLVKNVDWLKKYEGEILKTLLREPLIEDGKSITLFGSAENLHFLPLGTLKKAQVVETTDGFNVYAESGKHKAVLQKWLRAQAASGIIARAAELADQFDFRYGKITIRDQSTRWGSCARNRNLNFNWRLIFTPLFVLDYIILHELSHTREMNHSKRFWLIVQECMPSYQEARQWLKSHSQELRMY